MEDGKLILKLEQDLLKPHLRNSQPKLEKIIANGFVEIGQSGTLYNKHSIIKALSSEQAKNITYVDMRLKFLSKKLALVSYQTSSRGRDMVQRYSLWERTQNSWQILFHEAVQV